MTTSTGPATIRTRDDFSRALTALRERAGLSTRDLARRSGVPLATVGGYLSGRHLPQAASRDSLVRMLQACGEPDVEGWLEAAARVRRAPGPRPAGAPAPYRGLDSFGTDDAAWFFGRDDVVDRLVALVSDDDPLPVVVIGPSGSGKSSLLAAGLVPALVGWQVVVTTPGDCPVERLAEATAGWMRSDAEALAGDAPRAEQRLLVVDQLEELFAHDADAVRTAARELRAMADAGLCRVVLAVRSDFFTSLSAVPELVEAVQARQVLVGPLTAEQVRDVVLEPARHAQVEVEPALVDVVQRDLRQRGEALSAPGALPLLSFALRATWERGSRTRLTVADYQAAGGIEGALAASAEQVWTGLDDDARRAARDLLLSLTRLVDGVPVARRGADRPVGDGATARALDGLIGARLLTATDGRVELAHEALLWAWPRLAAWFAEDRDALRTRALLHDATQAWLEHGRDDALLHRGAPLAALLAWAETGPALGADAAAFLDASRAHAGRLQERDRRTARRTRRLSAGLAVALAVSLVLGSLSVLQGRDTRELRDRAVSRQLASSAERLSTVDASLSASLALAGYQASPTPEALAGLLAAASSPHAVRLLTDGALQQAAATSPDGRLLAAVGADAVVRVWRLGDEPVALEPVAAGEGTLFAVAFSPDGRTLVAGGGDGDVLRWRVAADGALQPLPGLAEVGATVYATATSPDGSLAVAASDGTVRLWAPGGWTGDAAAEPRVLTVSPEAVQAVAFSPDGTRLAAGGVDQVVHVVDVATGAQAPPLTGAQDTVFGVAFSPDGSDVFAAEADKHVHRFAADGTATRFEGPTAFVNGVAVSPDGRTVAGASSDGAVWLWDAATATVLETLPHPGPVTAVHWQGDGRLVTSGNDGAVRLWDLPTPSLAGPQKSLFFAGYSPDGRWLAAAGSDALHLRRVSDGRPGPLVSVPPPASAARFTGVAAFAPDSRAAVVGGADGAVHVVDLTGAQPAVVASAKGSEELVEQVAWSPDGALVAAGGDDNAVRLYDVSDRTAPALLATVEGPTSYVYSVAFSPDSRTLAVGSVDTTVRLYDVSTPARPEPLGEPVEDATSYVYTVAFSPDGRLLAAGSDDRRLRLYDVSDLSRPRLLDALTAESLVINAAFSPDGRTLAAGSGDGAVLVADVDDGLRLRTSLPASTEAVNAVGFSPDGATLVTAGAERATRLWPLDAGRADEVVCRGGGQALTPHEWERFAPDLAFRPPCG